MHRGRLFLTEAELDKILLEHPPLLGFWNSRDSVSLIRRYPTPSDPVYEVQLLREFGERRESYGWIWIGALEGEILRFVPDP